MCIITVRDVGMDVPENHCSICDVRFHLSWNRNPVFDKPDYCPFCGNEIDRFIYENDEQDEP